MPRKSAAALAVVRVDGKPVRLRPRDGAPADVAAVFKQIVATVAVDHFRPADGDLLEQLCQGIVLSRQAFDQLQREGPVVNGKASPWVVVLEKAHRSCVALSARLRLSPQQRVDPKTVGRQKTV